MNYPPSQNSKLLLGLLSLLLLAGSLWPLLATKSAQTAAAPRATHSQQFQVVAPGIEYLQIKREAASPDETTGPW